MKSLAEYQKEIYEINLANGWFDGDRTVGDDIALLHSEVSEAFEAYRSDGLEDTTPSEGKEGRPPKPDGFGSELADVLVRLLDTCERTGVDIEYELDRKIAYNSTRGYRHGNKRV